MSMGYYADPTFTASLAADRRSGTISAIYPDRPIHPLPKRRLRSRLSVETAESISCPPAPTPKKPLFGIPFHSTNGYSNDTGVDGINNKLGSKAFQGQQFGRIDGQNGYRFRGTELDSGEDEEDGAIRRYQERSQKSQSATQTSVMEGNRGNVVKYAKMSLFPSAPPSADSTDGYESFENTNNKKKRKIPTSGSLGVHHSSLSVEMAHMAISTKRDMFIETSQSDADDGVGQYYGTGSSAIPATTAGTGISGAGRGRYGRAAARTARGRSPLGVSINGPNALQGTRQTLQRKGFMPTAANGEPKLSPDGLIYD